jgi:hypothetical protein
MSTRQIPASPVTVADVKDSPRRASDKCVLENMDEIDQGRDRHAPGCRLGSNGLDLLLIAVHEGDPGALMRGVAALCPFTGSVELGVPRLAELDWVRSSVSDLILHP